MQAFCYDSVDSTNSLARRLVAEGRTTGPAYVVAREQTAGRGTHGRAWASPRDAGIYLTVIQGGLTHVLPLTTAYTLAAGVACAEAIRDATGVQVQLKPVNDLYADGRKLGGILTETVVGRDHVSLLLTGVGINVRAVPRTVSGASVAPVSLEELMPPEQFRWLDRDGLVAQLAERIAAWTQRVIDGDAAAVEREWEKYRMDADNHEAVP